jgi:acyl-CoA synthetase (AMP-forming)/AMP-acid ligase II
MIIYDFFIKSLQKKGNSIFISVDGKSYTYKQIHKYTKLYEANLSTKKFKSIVYINNNDLDHIIFYLLCSKNKITFVPLDLHTNSNDLAIQIQLLRKPIVICSKSLFNKIGLNLSYFNITKLKKKNKSVKANIKQIKNNKDFLISFTSGSTGNPKPIALSQKTKIIRAKSNIEIFGLKQNKKSLISTPLHHTLAIRILTISIIQGYEVYLMVNYRFESLLKIIKKKSITFTIFVSTQLNQLLKKKSNFKFLKSLVSLISSSSTLSIKNKKILLKYFDRNIFEMYGLSELGVVTNFDITKNKSKLNSVGKPINGTKIKIQKKKNEKIGEILVSSKYAFSGYYKNKSETKKSFLKKYFLTGDMGFIKNNFLYLAGRKKRMIKIKGISVYPEDIEKVFLNSNLINECVALPYKTKDEEEKIMFIYVSDKKNKNLEYSIKNEFLLRLAPFQIPSKIIRCQSIPKNKMGKINYEKLKENLGINV